MWHRIVDSTMVWQKIKEKRHFGKNFQNAFLVRNAIETKGILP